MNSQKLPTAEDFLHDNFEMEYFAGEVFGAFAWTTDEVVKFAIEFAKLHVQEALQKASEKVHVIEVDESSRAIHNGQRYYVDKKAILGSYPLENIK